MKVEIFRVEKTKNYTIMSNNHLKNKELSLKAKGLLSVILSLPETWDYSINGLSAISKESRDGINATLQELEKNKYIVRTNFRDENGHFQTLYSVYENKQTKKQEKELKQYVKNLEKEIKDNKKSSPIRKSRIGKNTEKSTKTPIRKSRIGKADAETPIRKHRYGNTDTVNPTQSNTNNKILNNKILKENTHLILSREDEIRNDVNYENFKKNIELNNLLKDYTEKPKSKENLQNILNIIKELYKIRDNNYITISGKRIYKNDIIETLNKYNYDTMEYVLNSISNNSSEIRNIKAYTIATLLNAPKTMNLYYQGKINNDRKKAVNS